MHRNLCKVLLVVILSCLSICAQMLQFGNCSAVETMKFFDFEKFLGQWYEVSRYPTWYEENGACAYKRIQYCGRTVEIEHVFVRDGIQFVLRVNSTYNPGDEPVFHMRNNNIDPAGIPLNVISTDYSNYAVVYGCRENLPIGLKYYAILHVLHLEHNITFHFKSNASAWILSREPTLPEEIYQTAISRLNAIPNANVAFLEFVDQTLANCDFYWTANVDAVDSIDTDSK